LREKGEKKETGEKKEPCACNVFIKANRDSVKHLPSADRFKALSAKSVRTVKDRFDCSFYRSMTAEGFAAISIGHNRRFR
jgi:hypothetical protein